MANKKGERRILDMFILSRPELVGLEIVESESPDFVIGGRIGIEVTEIFRDTGLLGSEMKAQEKLYKWLMRETGLIWNSEDRPHVDVMLHPEPAYPLTKNSVRPVAKKLVRLIHKCLPLKGERVELSQDSLELSELDQLPQEIHCVTMTRFEEAQNSEWRLRQGDFLPPLESSPLQSEITKKNSRVITYRQHAAVAWLLLVMDGFWLSGSFSNVPENTLIHEYSTTFDRVFLLDRHSGRPVELMTSLGSKPNRPQIES